MDLADGTLAGVSVRAGWRHHEVGATSAGSLAELSRKAGLGARIDECLLAQAITAYGVWVRRLPTHPGNCG